MTKAHEQAVLEALDEGLELTFVDLLTATELPQARLDEALWHLKGTGQVRQLPGGRFKKCDPRHSRCVKRGLFVKAIPTLCYAGLTYPVLAHLANLPWRVL